MKQRAIGSGFGLVAALVLGCSLHPRDEPHSSLSKDDDELAERSARALSSRGNSESFTPPSAERVISGPEQPSSEKNHAFDLWLLQLVLGKHPPLSAPPPGIEQRSVSAPSASGRFRLANTIPIDDDKLDQVGFSEGGREVLVLSQRTGTVHGFDAKSGKLTSRFSIPDYESSEGASFVVMKELPERPQLLVTRPSSTFVLDWPSGRWDRLELVPGGMRIEHSRRPGLYGVVVQGDTRGGGMLQLQWVDGSIALQATSTLPIVDWSLSENGELLAVGLRGERRVGVFDLRGPRLHSTWEQSEPPRHLALSPDGRYLATTTRSLQVYALASDTELELDEAAQNEITSICFSPDGRLLIAGSKSGDLFAYRLDDNESAKPLRSQSMEGLAAEIAGLAMSADGSALVASSKGGRLGIYSRFDEHRAKTNGAR